MADDSDDTRDNLIDHPHDSLFRKTFSDPKEAESLLRSALPPEIRQTIHWNSLTLHHGSFVDDALRTSQTDLLFEVACGESRESVWLYLLLEHQSTPDPRMPFRLLKYCCRIWDAQPPESDMRAIVPLVFYQGYRHWNHSTQFADMLPEMVRNWSCTVRVEHLLLDQTRLSPDQVHGEVKGRLARLAMMAAYKQHFASTVEPVVRLMHQLRAAGELEYVDSVALYIYATHDAAEIEPFEHARRRVSGSAEGGIMSYAHELIEKGRAEGRAEGRLNTVESLLRVGVTWDVIETETGLNEAAFQSLKERLSTKDDG